MDLNPINVNGFKPINVNDLKRLSDAERAEAIVECEEEKKLLIEEYMRIQDIVDQYNEYIYNLTCQVEQLNMTIREIQKDKVHVVR